MPPEMLYIGIGANVLVCIGGCTWLYRKKRSESLEKEEQEQAEREIIVKAKIEATRKGKGKGKGKPLLEGPPQTPNSWGVVPMQQNPSLRPEIEMCAGQFGANPYQVNQGFCQPPQAYAYA
mmetsp:Transcript_33971/g.54097  ORF Transcript_33971/g.54097 Transcript_33971/m.54097 type:complete len:121 (+) Transcript_33971:62-424(+)